MYCQPEVSISAPHPTSKGTNLKVRELAVKTAATRTKPAFAGSKPPVRAGGLGSDSCEFIHQAQFPNQ